MVHKKDSTDQKNFLGMKKLKITERTPKVTSHQKMNICNKMKNRKITDKNVPNKKHIINILKEMYQIDGEIKKFIKKK